MDNNTDSPIQEQPQIQYARRSRIGSLITTLVAWLALAFGVVSIVGGYYIWRSTNTQLQGIYTSHRALNHDIEKIDQNPRFQSFKRSQLEKLQQTNDNLKQLELRADALDKTQQELTNSLVQTIDVVSRTRHGWMLKEIEYLLQITQHRLQLHRDIEGATNALRIASDRINDIADPRLLAVREAITDDLRALEAVPMPDRDGVALRLDNVAHRLKPEILISMVADGNESNANPGATRLEHKNSIQLWFSDLLRSISDSIKISNQQRQIKLFALQQEQAQNLEFLRQKILGAKYAVMLFDDFQYHAQLKSAIDTLNNSQIFQPPSSLVQEVTALNEINLEPELPNIANTIVKIRELAKEIEE